MQQKTYGLYGLVHTVFLVYSLFSFTDLKSYATLSLCPYIRGCQVMTF